MFSLTQEEQRVVVFVGAVALVGLGLSFVEKSLPVVRQVVQPNENWTKIDVNGAEINDLRGNRFISQKLAQKIIAHRDNNGRFVDLEGLKNVKGVGNARYEKLKKIFYVE